MAGEIGGRSADVVVVGAGLSGLCTALHLSRAGLDVRVLEASEGAGGRVRTDAVDGLLLDRGFQLYNPSYPEGRRMLDSAALDLCPYAAGVVVAVGQSRHRLGDPRRMPHWAFASARAPVASPAAKARFALIAARAGFGPVERLLAQADSTTSLALAQCGVTGPLTERVLRPFFAGVFGEDELATSRRFADLVLRSFVRGTPSVPAAGMGAIPTQLAGQLPPETLVTSTPVQRVLRGSSAPAVETDRGLVRARAVVVAADPVSATALLDHPAPRMNALTTLYHLADQSPTPSTALHLDGDRRGPVLNTSVISNVAPSYASGGRALISSTMLGARDDGATEAAVRAHLGRIYGVDTGAWEHVRSYPLPQALPAMLPPLDVRRPVALGDGIYVAGDWRDTASIQGAMVSGRRAAAAVLQDVRP